MQPIRTRVIAVAAGGMGAMNMTVSEPVLGARPIDTRPAHVRANQAPRSQRRR